MDISTKLYKDDTIKKIQAKMELLGVHYKPNPISFLNTRLLTSILVFIISLYFFEYGFIYAPVFAIIYYNLFTYYMLDKKINMRNKRLNYDALYFFEVLTLSLESRRNLEDAISITCSNIDSELSDEFKRTLYEVKIGKSLGESLNDMKKRIPSSTINNIILNITESNIFGNSIVETMYNQIDYLADKKILTIRENMSKIPTRISIISVLFYIPLMLLLTLSPILLEYLGM